MAKTSQFYISNVRADDIQRCRESKAGRYPIIITGRRKPVRSARRWPERVEQIAKQAHGKPPYLSADW